MELGRMAASRVNEVVEIPSDDEADIVAKPPVLPRELEVSLRELAGSWQWSSRRLGPPMVHQRVT